MNLRRVARTRRRKSNWLSYKERRVDALALRADERRDKLRKASGRSKYPLIRRYLNGETRLSKPQSLHGESIAMQREPGELKHLSSRRKRKKHRFPKQRRAKWEEPKPACVHAGVKDCIREPICQWNCLGSQAIEGESPVHENNRKQQDPEYHETRETLWERAGTTP